MNSRLADLDLSVLARARESSILTPSGQCVCWLATIFLACSSLAQAGDSPALAPQWTQAIVDAERPATLLPARHGAVLLQTDASLTSWAYDGRLRWRYALCPGCRFEAVATTTGGGAWLVEAHVPPVAGRAPYRLIELDASAGVVFELALDRIPVAEPRDDLFLDVSSEAVTVFWNQGRRLPGDIGWTRVRTDRSDTSGEVQIDAGPVHVKQLVMLDDGDVLIAFNPNGEYCSPDLCLTEFRNLARFSFEQGVKWRRAVAHVAPPILLTASGSSWVGTNEAPFRIEAISPTGRTNIVTHTPGLAPPFPNPNADRLWELAGPVANRLLIQSVYGLRLIDSAGVVLADAGPRRWIRDWRVPWLQTRFGYLGQLDSEYEYEHAALFDSFDLRLLATARVPDLAPPDPEQPATLATTMTDDGAIVVAHYQRGLDGIERAQLASFALRGTLGADRIMRDGFEP